MWAALRVGGCVNGASPAYNAEEMAYALKTAQSKVLLTLPSSLHVAEDLEEMLEPFDQLRGVREASVNGSVTGLFAEQLASRMQSDEPPGTVDSMLLLKPKPLNDEPPRV